MSSKLKNILAFAKRGVPILPLAPGGTEAAVAGGVNAAVTNPRTLRRLFSKHPDYNYGLATGGEVFVVATADKRARFRLRALASEREGRLPKTVTFRLGTGRYYVFRSGGMQVLSSPGKLGKGVDVVGAGSFVLGPGSRLASGSVCRFAEGLAFSDEEIAKSPKWLFETIMADSGDGELSLAANSAARGEEDDPSDSGGGTMRSEGPTTTKGPARIKRVGINDVRITGARRECDPQRVKELAASMALIGLKTPITVRTRRGKRRPVLVAGLHRLTAASSLGWQFIDAIFMKGGKLQARLWTIAENLHRAELTAIQRADLVNEWVKLTEKREVFGQNVRKSRGGRPEGGVAKASRELRVSGKSPEARRKSVERDVKIAGISSEAKAAAKKAGLDNKRTALLEIAREDTPEAQVEKVNEIAKRKSTKSKEKRSAVDGGLVPAAEVEPLQADLAAANERQREEELETARAAAARAPVVDGSVKTPTDCNIPEFLLRLSPEDQRAVDDLVKAWDSHVRPLWEKASPVARRRFQALRITGSGVTDNRNL